MTDTIVAVVDGQRHEIPGIWCAGYCTANPGARTIDAVHWWHYQWTLEQREENHARPSETVG